jgi:CRISPR/Cas system-associated exonuclease Cas4 (RecB family)
MGRNVTRASIAYLDSGQIATVDVSEEKLEEARGIAQGCVVAIADGKYKTKSKKNCHCDYANICRFKSN